MPGKWAGKPGRVGVIFQAGADCPDRLASLKMARQGGTPQARRAVCVDTCEHQGRRHTVAVARMGSGNTRGH